VGDDDSGPEDLKDDLDLECVAVFGLKNSYLNAARAPKHNTPSNKSYSLHKSSQGAISKPEHKTFCDFSRHFTTKNDGKRHKKNSFQSLNKEQGLKHKQPAL